MTSDEYNRWLSMFKRYRLGGDPEDLCQEFLARRLEGRVNRRQSLKFFIIDRLREDSGRHGTTNYEARKTPYDMNHWASIVNTATDPLDDIDAKIDAKALIASITTPKRKLIAELYFLDEFTAPEIAEMFKVEVSGVYEMIRKIMVGLRRRALSSKPRRRHSPSET